MTVWYSKIWFFWCYRSPEFFVRGGVLFTLFHLDRFYYCVLKFTNLFYSVFCSINFHFWYYFFITQCLIWVYSSSVFPPLLFWDIDHIYSFFNLLVCPLYYLCHSFVCFYWLIFLLIIGHIFLLIFMNVNFKLNPRHCKLYIIWCYILLFS